MTHAIGIDIRMIRHTGIGTYVRGLLENWLESGITKDLDLAVFGQGQSAERFSTLPRYPFRSRIYSMEEQLEYPLRLAHCRLWHAPHYNVPFMKWKTKLVVTIHDLIHWVFRKDFFTPLQAFYAKTMFERAVKEADHVIAVSQRTRDDLVEYFNADPDRISVIYEGVHETFRELKAAPVVTGVREKYQVPETYFIFVGSLKPHKNVLWLIRLFEKLKRDQKIDAALVLVGKKDSHYPKGYEDLASFEKREGMVHIPYVEEEELVALYNGALALIHPSLYEGFGLTLIEAMACGTPVIACRSASVPEVVGHAAYLVDSCAERDMAEAIVRVEKFPNLREELKRKGRARAQQFRWEEAAAKTAEVYERVLSSS
jgi:glycosyltransferase involved in cell wall biosynthesis